MYTFEWKFQKKFICVLHTHLLNKIPTGLNNSLNPRLKHLAGVDDDLPVHAGHYLWDLGSKRGLGAMRLFIDLSLNFAPHEIIKKITILWAGRQDFLRPVVFQVSLRQHGWFWQCGRVKLLAQLQKFHTLPTYFVAKWWLVYITSYKRCTAFQWDLQNISMISRCLNTLMQKLS